MSLPDILAASDWLAIFPGLYKHTGLLEEMAPAFEPRFEIRMPPKEYTICPEQAQTVMVAYQKIIRPSGAGTGSPTRGGRTGVRDEGEG